MRYILFLLILIFSYLPAHAGCLDTGLVGHWKLNEGTGTTAQDTSGNSNDGTLTNGPMYKHGRLGYGVQFDGVDDSIVATSNTGITGDANVSLSIWANLDDASSGNWFSSLLSFGATDTGGAGMAIFWGAGEISVGFYGGTAWRGYVANTTSQKWVHIVATKSAGALGSSTTKLYVNGVDQSLTFGGSGTPNILTGVPYLGSDSANEWMRPGKIDDARIYNCALTSDEILQLYQGRPASITSDDAIDLESGLVGYWKLDETAFNSCSGGEDVCDSSGYGNHGIEVNTPTISTDVPSQITFANARSMDFDGTADHVTVSNQGSIDIGTDDATISFWFNSDNTGTDLFLLARADADGTNQINMRKISTDVNRLYVRGNTSGAQSWVDTTTAITPGKWYHLAGVIINSTNSLKIYLNGIDETNPQTSSWDGTTLYSSQPFYFGTDTKAFGNFWNGRIDDVRIYNRALSDSEIKYLAQGSYLTNPTIIRNAKLTNAKLGESN